MGRAGGPKATRNSYVFNILVRKSSVMRILRGISAVTAGKLLIPDILQNWGRGEGVGVTER